MARLIDKEFLARAMVMAHDQVEFLRQSYPDQSNDAIARALGVSRARVKAKAKHLGLHKSKPYISALQAKRREGNWPGQTAALGSYRIDSYGYLQRKISCEKGHHRKRWRSVHEIIWIEANGPIPPEHMLVFKPGMRTNILEEVTLDRIECITARENLSRNSCNNQPPELRSISRLRGELTKQIKRRVENAKEH